MPGRDGASLTVETFCLDPRDGRAVVILVDELDRRLPLWLGHAEAAAIQAALDGYDTPGPHTLLRQVIRALRGEVHAAHIRGLSGGVVMAELIVQQASERRALTARASDAIAVALHCGAPVLCDEALLDKIAARVEGALDKARQRSLPTVGAEEVYQSPAERWHALIEHMEGSGGSDLYDA